MNINNWNRRYQIGLILPSFVLHGLSGYMLVAVKNQLVFNLKSVVNYDIQGNRVVKNLMWKLLDMPTLIS